ncbi:MAG: hypothetical protein ACRCU3_00355 [Eubacteriaceae bacterium]
MKTISWADAQKLVSEGKNVPESQRRGLRQQRLIELVTYAKENSPFYKMLYKDIPLDFELSDLPITDKKMISENFDLVVTDRDVQMKELLDVNKASKTGEIPGLYLGKYSYVFTSGTTGNPLVVLRDDFHNKIHGALMENRLLSKVGPDTFSPKANKIASIIATDPGVSSYSSFLRMQAQYPDVADNMIAISIFSPVPEMVRILNEFKPDVLTGYPSVLGSVALEQLNGNLNIKLKSIACSAETLTKPTFDILKKAFNCTIVNNYCSSEGGEVAMSDGCPNMHLNDDWIIVEPIDEDGSPTPNGKFSNSVLVTDLTNFIMPIIRYKMTDVVNIGDKCPYCDSVFPPIEIQGRTTEPLTLCGKPLLGLRLIFLLQHVENNVLTYQFAKTAEDTLELRVVLKDHRLLEAFKARITTNIKQLFSDCDCPEATFIISDRPPVNNTKGGKLKVLIDETI